MLDRLRQRSNRLSLVIYLFFGIIIAVFVVNFGPQSQGSGCDGQPGSMKNEAFAAHVAGHTLASADFYYGFLLAGGGQAPPQMARQRRLKETVMDKLVERELLAAEGERLGFRVGDEEVEDMIYEGRMITLGYETPMTVAMKDGAFDYELFRRFVQFQLRLSVKTFIEQQRRELLANRVRQVLRGGIAASSAEVKADFVRKGNQVNLEYLRFSGRRFEDEFEPTAAEIEAHAKANEAKLKEVYDQRKFLYEKAPKEKRLRQILVKLDTGASADAEAAAKKKATELLARVTKGESFAVVAKAASDDTRSKTKGGSLGWRRQGGTSLGTALEEKLWAAKDGAIVGPEKGADGFFVVKVESSREGDIPFDAVKLELAEEQIRQTKAKDKAKAEAQVALDKARGTKDKSLKDLFPAAADSAVGAEGPPRAEETGLFSRRGNLVEGIGPSAELAKQAFGLTTEQPFAGPLEVGGSFVVVRLKEKKQADLAEFEKKKSELMTEASMIRGEEVLEAWAMRRCQEARDAKKIEINRGLLKYEDADAPPAYEPCTPPPAMRF